MKNISKLGLPPEEGLPPIPPDPNMCEDTLTLRLETPMMGGGVQAGDVDWDRPIRASSIRGHLRSWWRLFCAHNFSVDDLKARETEIFGSTDKPSKVYVDVSLPTETQNQAIQRRCRDYIDPANDKYKPFDFSRNGAEAYALFPVMPRIRKDRAGNEYIDQDEPGHDIAREGLTFTLTLRYPQALKDDIRIALAAWIYFGGIGARTRRGLGTVFFCSTKNGEYLIPTDFPYVGQVLEKNPAVSLYMKPADNALKAWKNILEYYKDYRQQRPTQQRKRPGRSHWPEPDSLRLVTGQEDPRHATPITSPLPAFPRASLGLPIIFHFIDSQDPNTQLTAFWNGNPVDRMSSPIITKPIYENGHWNSAVIFLPNDASLKVIPVIGSLTDKEQDILKAAFENRCFMKNNGQSVNPLTALIPGTQANWNILAIRRDDNKAALIPMTGSFNAVRDITKGISKYIDDKRCVLNFFNLEIQNGAAGKILDIENILIISSEHYVVLLPTQNIEISHSQHPVSEPMREQPDAIKGFENDIISGSFTRYSVTKEVL